MESTATTTLPSTSSTPAQQQQQQRTPSTDPPHRRRRPQPRTHETGAGSESAPVHSQRQAHSSSNVDQQNPPRRPPRPRKQLPNDQTSTQVTSSTDRPPPPGPRSSNDGRQNRQQRPPKPRNTPQTTADGQPASDRQHIPAKSGRLGPGAGRRTKFGGKLSEADNPNAPASSNPSERYRQKIQTTVADDLTSRLIRELSVPPYPDCPICFSSVQRGQPIWSCSPSIPTILPHDAEGPPQYCWTTFHLKCIRSWASKSVKDLEDAWRARGEAGRPGDWRCPGCQGKRELVPKVYWCFCGTTPEPKPPRLSTPHSCGGPCSRVRESGCGHACPLSCHPGPCPPCQVTTRLTCYCPRKSTIAFRCGVDQGRGKGAATNLSCGNVCGRLLGCGKHTCERVCHDGECGQCSLTENAQCWCGRREKVLKCGEGEAQECFVQGETPWVGRFSCDLSCDRLFDCGIHRCRKACHPPSNVPAPCPQSPTNVTHCPCGKSTIAPSPNCDISNYTFPARQNCKFPIPTCNALCDKPHDRCGHPCKAKCHLGSCPPCSVVLTRPCRCGSSTRSLQCHELYKGDTSEDVEILCDRPCTALRACGRHECRRTCCPLASLAMTSNKKGKKRFAEEGPAVGEERGGLHECDLVCGKMLFCGNHKCEERDHKGACRPCLRSSFDEMVCFCGRTVYEPPIPCGTAMHCNYPCPRPPLPCGHPRIPHACHEDPSPCPPCVHLTAKQCACGKKTMPNIRCSLESEKVSCGTTCGKLLLCGFHHCERSCHADSCGPCTAPCGKFRKLCLQDQHLCSLPCHAPSSCPETEPCQALNTLSCPCGRNKQTTRCGRSTSHPEGGQRPSPKCTTECAVAKRNAKLAEALGINVPKGAGGAAASMGAYGSLVNTATYNDEVVGFARANSKFLAIVEKALEEFVASARKLQLLPPMPPEKRKFVQALASSYRIDTQLVDQEPRRSVQLLRRLDTRSPTPLLSATLQSSASPAPNLGKLGDLRNMKSASSPNSSSSHLPSTLSTGAGPSWRPSPTPSPKPGYTAATSSSSSAATTTNTAATTLANRGWSAVAASSQPVVPRAPPGLGPGPGPGPGSMWEGGSTGGTGSRGARAPVDVVPLPPPPPRVEVVSVDEPVPENWEDDI